MEFLKWPFIIVSILGAFAMLYSWNTHSAGRGMWDFFSLNWLFDDESVSGGSNIGKITCFILLVIGSCTLIYIELPESMQTSLRSIVE